MRRSGAAPGRAVARRYRVLPWSGLERFPLVLSGLPRRLQAVSHAGRRGPPGRQGEPGIFAFRLHLTLVTHRDAAVLATKRATDSADLGGRPRRRRRRDLRACATDHLAA